MVIGHTIPDASTGKIASYWLNIVESFIYSFHMPLFFFFAGLFSKKILTYKNGIKSFLSERFCRLMLPYFIVGLAYMPVKIFLSSYANKPYHISDFGKILFGVNPDGELWFLYVLFVITIAVSLIAKNTIGKKGLVISFLIFVLGIINPFEIHLNAWLSLYEQFYFCIGVYVNNRMADSNIRDGLYPV